MRRFANKHVIVLGLAKSGVAVAKRLQQLGANVVVNDRKSRNQCPEAEILENLGIPVFCGDHPLSLLEQRVDLIVKNPGIPYQIPFLQQAMAQNIPIVTEVEIASLLTDTKIISITGSNGKTTTTTLVGEILKAGQIPSIVAGNIGTALSEVVDHLVDKEWLVTEVSSFQLKGTVEFHPRIAALLNLYPAHLDYHQSMEDYYNSKAKMFQNQTSEDIAVLNADSPACQQLASTLKANIFWFSRKHEVDQGIFIQDNKMMLRYHHEVQEIISLTKISLKGEVNIENAMAAAAITYSAGASIAAIRQVLQTFRGVEHRLEYVATVNQVSYYNDSKATNPQAALNAIQSFREPVIWIAGGLDRGIDFRELLPIMRERVKIAVVYGQVADILAQRAKEANITQIYKAEEITEAVQIAAEVAESGEVVLLSPACASWDQYTSFEERGRIFKQAVHNLY